MKVAISIPDDLFSTAEALANRLGVTRSRLISMALAEFVAKHRSSKVTERLDVVYAAQESRIDPSLRRAQRKAASRSDW